MLMSTLRTPCVRSALLRSTARGWATASVRPLMAKDFFFLALRRGINGSDGAIRQLLDFIFQPLAFVLTYFPFFLVRLETVHAVPANVPNRHAGFFRILPVKFGQLLTPFLGEIRDRQEKSLDLHNQE